jgi:hypothetical protein
MDFWDTDTNKKGSPQEYRGYLWEGFKTYNIVSIEEIRRYSDKIGMILFFWDSHPSMPFLYSIGKTSIFSMSFEQLLQHYFAKNLPEDIYIFDESLLWTISLTHESQNEMGFKNLMIGKIPT